MRVKEANPLRHITGRTHFSCADSFSRRSPHRSDGHKRLPLSLVAEIARMPQIHEQLWRPYGSLSLYGQTAPGRAPYPCAFGPATAAGQQAWAGHCECRFTDRIYALLGCGIRPERDGAFVVPPRWATSGCRLTHERSDVLGSIRSDTSLCKSPRSPNQSMSRSSHDKASHSARLLLITRPGKPSAASWAGPPCTRTRRQTRADWILPR